MKLLIFSLSFFFFFFLFLILPEQTVSSNSYRGRGDFKTKASSATTTTFLSSSSLGSINQKKDADDLTTIIDRKKRLPSDVSSSSSCTSEDPLTCYLYNMVIPIPNECFAIPGSSDLFCLNDLICGDIVIAGFPSAYIPLYTLALEIDDFGLLCQGNYVWGSWNGVMSATVSNTGVAVDILLDKESDGDLPISSTFTSCNVDNIDVKLKFDGTGGILLNTVSAVIVPFIQRIIKNLFCVELSQYFATNVTSSIVNNLDPKLLKIIHNNASIIPSEIENNPSLINWHDTFLQSIRIYEENFETSKIIACLESKWIKIKNLFFRPVVDNFVDIITNGTGEIVVSFPEHTTLPFGSLVNLTIESMTISGLNTFTEIEIMEPSPSSISNITLTSAIKMKTLDVKILVRANSSLVTGGFSEAYEATVKISNASVLFDLAIGINSDIVGSKYIGQFVQNHSCLLTAVDYLNITSLMIKANISEISILEVSPPNSPTLDDDLILLLNNVLALFNTGYNSLVTDLLEGVSQGLLRSQLNQIIAEQVDDTKSLSGSTCQVYNPQSTSPPELVVWSDNSMVQKIDKIANEIIGSEGLNWFMQCLTDGTGEIVIPKQRDWTIGIGNLSSFSNFSILEPMDGVENEYNLGNTIGLKQVSLSISNVQALLLSAAPTIPALLPSNTSMTFNIDNFNLYLNIRIEENIKQLLNLQVKDLGVTDCLATSLNALSIADMVVNYDSMDFEVMVNGATKDKNDNSKLLALLSKFLTPSSIVASINKKFDNKLSESEAVCANGGVAPSSLDDDITPSSVIDVASPNDAKIAIAVGVVFLVFALSGYCVYEYYYGDKKKKLFVLWDHEYLKNLETSSSQNSQQGVDDDDVTVEWRDGYRVSSKINSSNSSSSKTAISNQNKKISRWKAQWDHWECNETLIFQPSLPLSLRIGMVLFIISTFVLFIVSNLTTDAVSVMLTIYLGDEVITPDPLFNFGLASTVVDMWNAKVWILAVLIAFFSGFWPYFKLWCMLMSLLLPPGLLSVSTRGAILKFVDAFGKWSLIDGFVMVMFMCAFYLELPFAPGLFIKVTVLPKFGFYSFLFATILSLVGGHVVVNMHRWVQLVKQGAFAFGHGAGTGTGAIITANSLQVNDDFSTKNKSNTVINPFFHNENTTAVASSSSSSLNAPSHPYHHHHPNVESLIMHRFSTQYKNLYPQSAKESNSNSNLIRNRFNNNISSTLQEDLLKNNKHVQDNTSNNDNNNDNDNESEKTVFFKITNWGRSMLCFMLASTLCFTIGGTLLYTFSFRILGLTGWILELLGEESKSQYSFLSVSLAVPKASGYPQDFFTNWVVVVVIAFGLAMPLLFIVSAAFLWFLPLTLQQQRRLFIFVEILHAWSALDVFVLSIVAAILEVRQFATFIVGDSCDGINIILMKYLNTQLDGDDKCFDVIAIMETPSWVIFTGAGLLFILAIPTIRIADKAIEERTNSFVQQLKSSSLSSVSSSSSSGNINVLENGAQPGQHHEVSSDFGRENNKVGKCIKDEWCVEAIFLRIFFHLKLIHVFSDGGSHVQPNIYSHSHSHSHPSSSNSNNKINTVVLQTSSNGLS